MFNLYSFVFQGNGIIRDVKSIGKTLAFIAALGAPERGIAEDLISAETLIEVLGNPEEDDKRSSYKTTRSVDLRRGIAGVRPGSDNAIADRHSDSSTAQHSFNNVLFESNSAQLRKESFQQLNEIGKALEQLLAMDSHLEFIIEGHTDNRGSTSHNQQLSLRRAEAVRDYLVTNFGVQEIRLTVRGGGELQPVTDNDTAFNRRVNRRVVLQRSYQRQ